MAPNIQIQSHSLTLSAAQKEYITTKVEKIFHFSGRADDESSMADVKVENEGVKDKKARIHCIVNIAIPQANLHADCYGATVESAVDECEDKLTRQIHKYKVKLQS